MICLIASTALAAKQGWQQIQEALHGALPDCAKIGLIQHFVGLEAIYLYALKIGYRYTCIVLVESQI